MEAGVTFAGNDYDVSNWGGGCSDPIPYVATGGSGSGLITTQSSGKFHLDCESQGGFSVPLPNGDLVQIFCPRSGETYIPRLDHNYFAPPPCPLGYNYAIGVLNLKIIPSR